MKVFSEKDILKQFIKQAAAADLKTEDDLHRFKKTFCKDQELRSKAFLFFLLFLLRKNYLPHKAYNSFE